MHKQCAVSPANTGTESFVPPDWPKLLDQMPAYRSHLCQLLNPPSPGSPTGKCSKPSKPLVSWASCAAACRSGDFDVIGFSVLCKYFRNCQVQVSGCGLFSPSFSSRQAFWGSLCSKTDSWQLKRSKLKWPKVKLQNAKSLFPARSRTG